MTKTRILVVEDEEDFRVLMVGILEGAGYRVEACEGAEAGVAAFARRAPDLVVLDFNLPDGEGPAVCARMRAARPGAAIPILLCTVRLDKDSVLEAESSGATGYIVKPFEERYFLERVAAALPPPG